MLALGMNLGDTVVIKHRETGELCFITFYDRRPNHARLALSGDEFEFVRQKHIASKGINIPNKHKLCVKDNHGR